MRADLVGSNRALPQPGLALGGQGRKARVVYTTVLVKHCPIRCRPNLLPYIALWLTDGGS